MNITNPTTFGTPSLTLSTSNSSGTGGALRADDTILVYDTNAVDAITFGQSGSVGSASTSSRRDHAHAMAALAVPLTAIDIDGGTDIGAAIVDADLFIVDDGAGGTNRKTAASRIKTYIETSLKVGTFTRNTATASGDQSITGVGFEPKSLLFMGGQSDTSEIGFGLSDGSTEQDLYDKGAISAGTWGIGNNRALTFAEDGSKVYYGTVDSMDADGFTITWTRASTPTGTLTIMYLAIG